MASKQGTEERLTVALADRYKIEREIGSGGMATVYLAEDRKQHRQVAIKVLRPELAHALGPERFHREIQIAANLTHPHILPVHDSGEADGFLFYVMSYVEGGSLRDRLNIESQLPIGTALEIAREAAVGLAHAHSHGVVHRDIKPENIMLSGGSAVVTDFGIARAVSEEDDAKLTETGISIGTPAYMSPEQATGEQNLDGRSDLYSLGCVLYEMLAGQAPFTGPTTESLVHQHLTTDPHPVTSIRSTVPPQVEQTLSRSLAKSPADRQPSAQAFADELRSEITTAALGFATPLVRAGFPYSKLGFVAGSSILLILIVYALVMLIGLPDWVFLTAVGLVVLGLPPLILTGHAESGRKAWRGGEAPPVSDGIHSWFTWRRFYLGSGIAFSALGVATAAYMAMRVLGIGPAATLMAQGVIEERDVLIVADFDNHTGDSTLALALTGAIHTDLTQSPTLTVMSPGDLMAALQRMERTPKVHVSAAVAREIAVREGVKAVLVGEINAAGTGYVLSAQLLAAESNEILTAVRVTARDSTRIVDAIDDLSAKLRERIGESLKTIRRSPRLSQVTTASLPALRRYTRAVESDDLGDVDKAKALLEEAVRLDTAFAMAYRKLGQIMGNRLLSRAAMIDALTKAYDHRERLTEREGLLAAAAYHSRVTGEGERVIQDYEALLDLDPDDPWALNNLGVEYVGRREHARAAQAYARAFEVDSTNSLAITNLASTFLALGDLERSDSAIAVAYRLFPNDPSVAQCEAEFHFAQGEFDRAFAVLDSMREATQSPYWKLGRTPVILMFIDALMGRTRSADRRMDEFTVAAESMGTGGAYLQFVSAKAQHDVYVRGLSTVALALLDAAVETFFESLAPEDRHYADLAEAYAVAGNIDRALELLEEGERLLDPSFLRQIRASYLSARGYIALADNRFADAVTEFRLMDAELGCTICPLHGMGTAYRLANEPDSAIAVFERYLSTPKSGGMVSDAVWQPSVLVQLGELYEERGDSERAADYYDRLVHLWQEADPELMPQVEAARAAAARLRGKMN
ncbi:MAG: protein kinase [Gemmatimonadetes bacterium]|nr:protein kinase [Gemmatimonadota bacterium]NNM05339.1 protein kinase [Gemmatimonadota bacterium]